MEITENLRTPIDVETKTRLLNAVKTKDSILE